MQPKKRPSTRGGMSPPALDKGQGPRRPVGMQAMGTLGYEQLRRALLLLGGAAGR
ncbi:hypothetical protein JRI60_12430 [Archangium violaceum]|jgi:hypothetical protein|uniref:hypothetical protein n=1 Tax=Archangium violaceum TaxID=83451 RepID=UPI00194F8515|nr:hypothetical protein [Archangium violaceum]QRN99767.1 hypothetical protein JRI60_12430 [Archangium violaceum]